ncbi:MAG TPA: hypothetical protein VKH42_10800 [Vicinamibacterales bacterium]|nr:hypothetical protein [Vicinamibacterales bacterium]
MPILTVVGHFSTWLLVAWVAWLIWAAWQAVWYRRLRAAEASVPVSVDPRQLRRPEPATDRTATLRSPGSALRTMTPAAPPGPLDQPPSESPVEPPAETPARHGHHDEHDDITPS